MTQNYPQAYSRRGRKIPLFFCWRGKTLTAPIGSKEPSPQHSSRRSRDALVHRDGETEARWLQEPERGDWQQPLSSPSPRPGLAPGRDIYKADKGAERIFQTPKLRNLSSPSMDIVFNYRLGMGGSPPWWGWWGPPLPRSPQRAFTLLSLTAESPQGQAPACATVSPCGTQSLRVLWFCGQSPHPM